MAIKEPSEEVVFNVARKVDGIQARRDYLAQACGADAVLHARVSALLEVHEQQQSFLATPAALLAPIADAVMERAGTLLGPYQLIEQIGEGGFGLVFLAEQQRPVRRQVAVKVIKPGIDSRHVSARFKAERQALALMDHPNIAKVLDAGETQSGCPYFAMELVRGVPITEYCVQRALGIRERLQLFVTVCAAVQHAHQKGIIHRDLKPSNVLVTMHDGAAVAKVIDFGIAKGLGAQLTDKTLFTSVGQLIGTPMYMSPEQAEMNGLDIDTRSDIYSLGVLLYELLTGATPFDKERLSKAGYDEIRRILREEEPARPSTRLSTLRAEATVVSARQLDPKQLSQMLRGELDWIVMKALEKERSRRYETAAAFAQDIQHYLRDEPVSACPPSRWYSLRKLARRNKGILLTAALVALALVVGTAVSVWQAVLANHAADSERQALADLAEEQKATQRELGRARVAEGRATRELFDALVAEARANRLSRRIGQRFRTLEIVRRATALARQLGLPAERFLELRNEAIAALALTDLRLAKEWTDANADTDLVFERPLARYVRADMKGTVFVRRAGDGAEICRVPAPALGETWLDLSPNGRLLAVLHPGRSIVQVWKLPDDGTSASATSFKAAAGKTPTQVIEKTWYGGFCFSPDSTQFALQRPDHSIDVIDVATATEVEHLAPVGGVSPLVFNPKGDQLALVARGSAQVRDRLSGKVLWELRGGYPHEWHPDGKTLAVIEALAGGDAISLWDVPSKKQIGKLEGLQGGGTRSAFNNTGSLLASTGWSSILRLWDPRASRQLFSTHVTGQIIRFSPDNRFLAGTYDGNNVRIWEIAGADEYRTLTASPAHGQRGYVCAAISPDGQTVAGGAAAGGVGLWDLTSGKPLAFLQDSPAYENFVLWESSGALLGRGHNGLFRRTIRRDPVTGNADLGTPERLPIPGLNLGFAQSGDGRVLAAAQLVGGVVLHADQPDQLVNLGPHKDARYVAVSPDGQWVVTGGFGYGGAKVWHARTGKLHKELATGVFCRVVFSPDGKRLLTSSGIVWQLRAWDVDTWTEVPIKAPLKGANPAFSPDGKLLAVETSVGVTRLLDPQTFQEYARLEDPNQDRTDHFAFSANAAKLVCATGDGRCLHVWDLQAIRRQLAELGLDW